MCATASSAVAGAWYTLKQFLQVVDVSAKVAQDVRQAGEELEVLLASYRAEAECALGLELQAMQGLQQCTVSDADTHASCLLTANLAVARTLAGDAVSAREAASRVLAAAIRENSDDGADSSRAAGLSRALFGTTPAVESASFSERRYGKLCTETVSSAASVLSDSQALVAASVPV